MTKKQYVNAITKDMQNLNIYREEYALLVETLAQTCAFRDKNMAEWEESGFQMAIEYTNKAGATNISKSPYYLNNLQFNEQILKYCKELCLSPSGISKLGNPTTEEKDQLEELMEEFSGK